MRRATPSIARMIHNGFLLAVIFGVGMVLATALTGANPMPQSSGRLTAPHVWLIPRSLHVNVGDRFSVQVLIAQASHLGGYEFRLRYDPSVVHVLRMSDERFLANQGDQVFSVAPRIDNEVGELAFASVILGIGQNPAAGAEGSGRLAVVEMEAVAEGQTTLELQEVHLVDSNQRSQPLASITGSVVIATLPGSPVTAPAPPTPYVAATPAPRVSQLVSTDSKETQLTFEGFAGSPVWSPDGSKVAFVKRTEDQMVPDLWVMNADGSGQRKLADNAYWPAWSSDGQMLIYTSKIGQGVKQRRGEIWVVRVDGTGHRKLTDSDFNRARWLPDVRVAFLRDGRLYSVNSEGQEQTFLSALNLAGQFHETSFIISPNGTKLAYHSRNRLWIANVDGTQAVEISKGFDGAPENLAWSPDGTQVVYVRPSMGVLPELWVVNADGTDARMLARGEYEHFEFPTWSPDSRTIAFVRRPTGSGTAELSEIYVVNVDGSGLRRVTDNHFNEGFLAWSPDGSKIAFTRVEMNGVEPVTQTIWVLEIR